MYAPLGRLALKCFPVFLAAVIVLGATASGARAADPNFGQPPAGEYPILYNDHTVYATPDILKQNRVLAALVKDGQIYVPLRSMFEQMGATVSVSADGKTITATKPDASVSVTLGSSDVIVNGERRPLDVPPMVYHGVILVPVRVLSEALGAYVQWVPDRRVVVVRYIPIAPAPPPTAAPTAPPTLAPTPAPTPTPTPTPAPTASAYQAFVQAAFLHGNNYNEFSAGQFCRESYLISGAIAPSNSHFAVKVDFRQDVYVTSDNLTDAINNHYTHFATIDGGYAYTPVFLARQNNVDVRLEYKIAAPRLYVGLGYLHTADNYGYPHLNALGAGIEKLPDFRSGISFYGSAFYYPRASGTYTIANPASPNNGTSYRQQYAITKFDIGFDLASAHFPIYLYGGVSGDRYTAKQHAPIDQTHGGPYLGLGVKL